MHYINLNLLFNSISRTDMARAALLILKLLMILIFAGWVSLWLLKPTELWTRAWHGAEESAEATVFGYSGLDFAVYTFPLIAFAITGFLYLELKPSKPRSRRGHPFPALSRPLIINSCLGILSAIEILAVLLFIVILAWTFYVRISNDFKNMIPIKSFKLKLWQYKILRIATRCGLLAEACLALLILPILRGLAIFRFLGIQFEASVRYHTWLGTAMVFFATFHGAGTLFIWGVKHHIQEGMWKWQKTGRIYLAGEISLITGLVIWITSLPQIRRKWFEIFYYTHHLYILFFVFFLFHTGDRHFYMVFPGIFLFGLDKVLRIIQSRPETCILSARIFPCKAVELTLSKDPRLKYSPTSVIFIKIPSISKFQWHSFSIISTSTVDDDTMCILIKSDGWWTSSVYDMIQSELDSDPDRRKCIPIAIEGPYGPASVDFLSRYDSLLLVAGGIGITPFLSILQEISSCRHSDRHRFPARIQLIYALKKSQDIYLLSPILPQLLNQKAENLNLKVKVFVTREEQSGATFRQLLNELSQMQSIHLKLNRSTKAVYGPESFLAMAALVGFSSIVFLVFLIILNHIFRSPAKETKQKIPSSVTDLLLLCSFVIAIIFTTLVAISLRWKRAGKKLPSFSDKKGGAMKISSLETERAMDEHEIHFRGRPNFQDIFSKFWNETGGSNIGVLVCGPESMKESVASMCKLNSQGSRKGDQRRKPSFTFHSLNFTL